MTLKVDAALFAGGDNLYEGDLDAVPGRARLVERQGLDGAFVLDSTVDPFLALSLAAEHTETVELLTGVAVAFARSPMTTALQAWNLQDLSDGRLVLGLGSQVRAHIEKRFSMPWGSPARRMREYVCALRDIWKCWGQGDPLEFRGEFYQHTLMTPTFNPGPIEPPPPKILLGALGPKMVEVAGEVADGLYGHPFTTADFVQQVQLPSLRTGWARGNRDGRDFMLAAMVMIVTGRDEREMEAAESSIRQLCAFYGSTPAYYKLLAHHGREELGPVLNAMSKEGLWKEMAQRFDNELLDVFAVRGWPDEIPYLIANRYGEQFDRVSLYAPYPSDSSMWEEIVEGIQRQVQQQTEGG